MPCILQRWLPPEIHRIVDMYSADPLYSVRKEFERSIRPGLNLMNDYTQSSIAIVCSRGRVRIWVNIARNENGACDTHDGSDGDSSSSRRFYARV